MVRGDGNSCKWDVPPLEITEILPNAIGSDTGNEFIEVHNNTNQMIDLSLYSVAVGINGDKVYGFPVGATIAPGEYRAFSDSLMKFTLVNTTSRVVLNGIDGSVQGDTGAYDSPADGESWALID
ncbi:MAG TPA: lamin tail domain-containing protein, partial [Candidatus Bathyarchaeia archaeon]|nr:lamin tail domain-containing protein [Candidatus Bathyarchaeia archaeon]